MTAAEAQGGPLEVVHSALLARGLTPKGTASDFRSRCPAHRGESATALHVTEGSDGRVLLHCFRGCTGTEVADALGLSLADLFPLGHRRGRRRQLPPVRRADFTGRAQAFGGVLAALERTGASWTAMLSFTCPACGRSGAWLRSVPGDPEPVADCPGGCRTFQIASALAARVAEASR